MRGCRASPSPCKSISRWIEPEPGSEGVIRRFGGFARIGGEADTRATVMGEGSWSADVCVHGADPVLGKKLGLERQWLHARSLGFAHPADGRQVEFTSSYPEDLQHALEVLRAT